MYCDVFGISDLGNEEKPYALVEIGPKDGFNELSPIYARMREFRIYSINERYSVDLIQFLNMPRHMTDRMIDDARIGLRNTERLKNSVELDALKQLKKDGYPTHQL